MTYRTKARKGRKGRKGRKNKTQKRLKGGELLDKSIPPPGYMTKPGENIPQNTGYMTKPGAPIPNNMGYPPRPPIPVAPIPNNMGYPPQPPPIPVAPIPNNMGYPPQPPIPVAPIPNNMGYPPQPPPIPVANTQNTGLQSVAHGNLVQIGCPDAKKPCNLLDKQYKGKQNQTWDTCINMNGINNHIIYLTSNNVLIKSPETIQIPEFKILMNNVPTTCKIMIKDKYIASFIFICGNWYAMMRLLGTTINVDYLARTEKNEAFYLLNGANVQINTNNPDQGSGLIIIPNYDIVSKEEVSQKLSTSKTPTIRLPEGSFKTIDKSSMVNNQAVFNVLQRFRQQKLAANDAKQEVANTFVEGFLALFGL